MRSLIAIVLASSASPYCCADFDITRTAHAEGDVITIRTDTDQDLQKCELYFALVDGDIALHIVETRANGSLDFADRTLDLTDLRYISIRCGRDCPQVVEGYGRESLVRVSSGSDKDDYFANLAYANGGRGDDRFIDVDYADGGAGDDVIHGCTYADGARGDDIIVCRENSSGGFVYGGAGDDIIVGSNGADTLYGDLTLDNFNVPGRDIIFGLNGHDHLYGGGDYDYLNGGPGNDYLDPDYSEVTYNTGTAPPNGDDIEVVFGGEGADEFVAYHINGTVIPVFHDVNTWQGDFLTRIYRWNFWGFTPSFGW